MSLHVAAAGLPALGRVSCKGQRMAGTAAGLRLPADRMALKTAFYNAGSSLALPDTDSSSPPRITMRTAAKGAYICKDCGYIYTGSKSFEKLPDDFYCPVCGAPKRRFKPYDMPVAKNANDQSVRKARKADLQKDAAIGSSLPIGIAVGLAALVGIFVYLNSTI